MAGPLIETKLHVPRRRRALVPRPRLEERLGRVTESALTLVSAPAGFGKTTVLTQWLSAPAEGRSVAWLSLDERDDDPMVFWTYVVAAVRTAVPEAAAGALALLQSAQPSPDAVLATLANDLSATAGHLVLVLDDFHVIESPEVLDGLAFLLEHLPPQVHPVIAGRADPALHLARWRAGGDLLEIRAADLRFTAGEAATYLNGAMGLALTADDVAALEGRTEGWIAALQLAALSMQGRDDVAGFIGGFAGDDRYVVDYLVEEVLQRQPGDVRGFLLQTSVLGRLTGPLCDAVTGGDGGQATLEALDRGNLFLVPLDDRRRWYRYHHLFADVLQVHLRAERPDVVPDLHRRASAWFERSGDHVEAVEHALAGGDPARAADLVEPALPALLRARQEATVRRWLEALPDEVIRVRPVLGVAYAGALMVRGEVEGVEARLQDAERWLETTTASPPGTAPGAEMVVVDDAGFRRLPSAIAMYRAGQALLRGDVAGTVAHARTALDLATDDDHLGRGGPAGLLGLAYWTSGDLEAGHRWYAEAAAALERGGYLSDVTGCAIALADIRTTQGRLGDALRTYEQALQLVTPGTGAVLRGAADMHVGIAAVLLERGDLEGARRHLATSSDLGEHADMPQNPYRSRVVTARLREAEGDLHGALALLDEAQRRYVGDYFPEVRPVAALRARTLARHGRWVDAVSWAEERGLSVDDDLDHLREFEYVTLARALVARYAAEGADHMVSGALALLQRLVLAAEQGGRTGSVLDVLVVQALAHGARGDRPAALAALRRALTLAERQGHVRLLVDEGVLLADPLRAVAVEGPASGSARHLLAAMGTGEGARPPRPHLVDPLSPRELEVLRMLGTDLDGPDIARRLFVSVNTVRTHTKHVYAKLGVTNRRAAVRRGAELGLLSPAREGAAAAVVADR
ncbi:LuxR C-terminal-related transcriptional regulator [Geodermatophilus aquaeductus]|uniref:LuxR family transcriptional regulator, maltose regulon positive regulatory protein n=1 Tax=Geodermatophilus aquaeductus TaxID=1564161 RepID=A0A521FTC0_9ACTN|nr:LuxR C-terminal-related transcriptional regulator [Geodermatophilus aquaeductus]SMO99428.1 LuxR family transcriptional regulator, maltose regulon positive regulatory protein [Geodermatophilus aquaeductus]